MRQGQFRVGRFIAIIWALATVVVNVEALAALLGGIGLAPSAWNPPFDAIGQIYDQAVRFSFSAIAGPIESRMDWRFPWWSGHAAAIYAATASAILALGGGVARRESLIEVAKSGGLSFAWPVAFAAFLWQAVRLRIVTRFARQHTLVIVGYFAMVGGAYAGARYLNETLASDAPGETYAAHVGLATVGWRAEALANIEDAELDTATAAAWRRIAANYGDELFEVRSIAGAGPFKFAHAAPDDHQVFHSVPEPAQLINIAAQGNDPRAAEWERLNAEASRLYNAGKYFAAEVAATKALLFASASFGYDHPYTISSINNLATAYYALGRYKEAEAEFIRALKLSERAFGLLHENTLYYAGNLAGLYFAQGRYLEAETLFNRVLIGRRRNLGENHRLTLFSFSQLARLYLAQGKDLDAEKIFNRVYKARERLFGKTDSHAIDSLEEIASVYAFRGRYVDAEPLVRRALQMRERILGREHPYTLASIRNLAAIYMSLGRYAEAEPLVVRALEASERVLGKEHPVTLSSVERLAGFLESKGDYAAAEPLYRRALNGFTSVLGREHPDTIDVAIRIARLYLPQGRYIEAEPLIKRGLEVRQRVLGRDHPDTFSALAHLAALYSAQGRYKEADSIYKNILTKSELILGNEHPLTIQITFNYAWSYTSQGRFTDAEMLLLDVVKRTQQLLGREHEWTLHAVNLLAMVYISQERIGDAEALLLRTLETRARVLGKEHLDTLESLQNYFFWRENAGRSGLKSAWSGDAGALRLLGELVPVFEDRLASGVDPARLYDPTSLESRGRQLLYSYELVRLAGVRGSDGAKIVSDASALSQRFNLSSVAAALSASSLRLADPKRRALLDERTRLGREIDDRYKALAKLQSAERRLPAGEASIQADIDGLAKQAAAITAQLRVGDQGQAEIDGVIVEEDLAKVGAALRPDEALIAYSSVGRRYLAFVTTRKGSTAVALGVERDEIAKQVTELRKGLRLPFTVKNGKEIASNKPGDLPAFDLALANKLHGQLIAPLAPHLGGVRRLVIVPDGPLQSLPFGVLVEKPAVASLKDIDRYKASTFLVDRYAVSMQPSVSAIRALRAKTPRAKGDLAMLGFADPALSGKATTAQLVPLSGIGDAKKLEDLPELPQMRSLLTVVGSALGARPEDLRFREKAQEADFRSFDATLPRYRMLTFATHGLVSNEIKALNLEEPALVMSLPPVKGGYKRPLENDGLLRASDIVDFDMDADLVILAACNTAAADGTPGAEPLSGLAKAFMARGARALLVSHWQADANSSAVLIPAMARYAEKDGFSEGLAKAQRDLRKNAAFDPDPQNNTLHYAHPAIWGAFTLIGDPGR